MQISFRTKNYMYSYLEHTPPKLQMHMHNYYEILYITHGHGSYLVENTAYPASPGDMFITRPGEIHTITFDNNDKYVRYFIQFNKELLADTGIDLLYMLDRRPAGQHNKLSADTVSRYRLGEFFDLIEPYIVNRVPESDILVKTYIIQMLVRINSALREYNDLTINHDKRTIQIKEYIENNLSHPLSLDELSEHFFMNKYHMCHMFKNDTGLSVLEYINTRRISRAQNLFNQGHSLTALCFECGFNDYSSFYKTVKKLTGIPPLKFFKNNKQININN